MNHHLEGDIVLTESPNPENIHEGYTSVVRDWFIEALSVGANLSAFQSELKQAMSADSIMEETAQQLKALFQFQTVGFMTIDEQDYAFKFINCIPNKHDALLDAEADYQIDQGIFAQALSQSKAVVTKTQDGKNWLILHTLATRSRIRGMFIGISKSDQLISRTGALDLLSMMLLNTSNAIENHELYQWLREQNKSLEGTVKQRTLELEKARIAAEAANEAKSQFLANISHEIRTPLTVILGLADLIHYQQLSDDEQKSAVSDILKASKHLSDIINDILDISKIEANKLEVELIATPLFHLLDEVASIARAQAVKKGLDFTIEYGFPLPRQIKTDPTRIKQILLNLCNNACKFTETGGVRICVDFNPDSHVIIFAVIDSGIGISDGQQSKLFQKFVQADESTSRQYGGTGLGLAISKQLAQKLGGDITLRSAPGEGSCFEVTIDAGAIDRNTLIHELSQLPAPEKKVNPWDLSEGLSGCILLAEDNKNSQQMISLVLRKAGISVEMVDNGNDVVEKALSGSFDLILMDMQMPGMGGIEATVLLRQVGYAGAIIALTANATIDVKHQCHEAGFDGFLSKPLVLEEFFTTVGQYLKTSTINAAIPLNDPDFQRILEEFVQSLPAFLEQMEFALQQRQWPQLQSLAHQLKGVAGSYGYSKLGKIAAIIQQNLERQNFENIPELYRELRENYLNHRKV